MNPSETPTTTTSVHRTTVNGLAIVGFVALVVVGLGLALYSTRFIPTIADRIGTAAVYLGSVFNPDNSAALSVVPTASTTIDFGTSASSTSSSIVATSTSSASTTAQQTKPVVVPVTAPASTPKTRYVAVSKPVSVAPYGRPDLAVNISAIGYLTDSSPDSFVTSPTVPRGDRPAVTFTIKNVGTNWSGTGWRFTIDFPLSRKPSSGEFEHCDTLSSGIQRCTSYAQATLGPGDWIDYTFGFDRATSGTDERITITAVFDSSDVDSAIQNNTALANLTVLSS